MKNIVLFFIFCLLCPILGNSQYVYFNQRIVITNYWDVCKGIVPLSNGYLIAGGHGDENNYAYLYLSKLDNVGNLKWTKDFKEPGYAYYFGLSGALFKSFDNKIIICGSRVPGNKGYSLIIKTDTLGNEYWQKEFQFSDANNNLNSGNITNDSGLIVTGRIREGSEVRNKYLLFKTDSLGNLKWYQTYTDNHPNRNYEGKSVIQTPDSGYCIGGLGGYWPTGSQYRSIVEIIKTDRLGNQQWKKTYGNPLFSNWGAMLCLSKDTCIIGTYSIANTSIPEDDKQLYFTKIGLDGNEKWNKRIGFPAPSNGITWVQTLNDESFIMSGAHLIKDTISKCIGYLFKIKSNGDSLWFREYSVIHGPLDQNQLFQVTPTPDNGFAAAGSLFPGSSGGTQDIWVLKTDSLGCLVPNCDAVDITEFNPNAGALMLIYPNPFKEAFAINYYIPEESKIAVFKLYDIYGKLVYQTNLTKEVKQLQVVASALTPGVYIARLIVNNQFIKTEKIIKN